MKLKDFVSAQGVSILPFGFGSFVFALMLLFAAALPAPLRRWTIPSSVVYLLGLGNLIFIKEPVHRRHMARTGQLDNLPVQPLRG